MRCKLVIVMLLNLVAACATSAPAPVVSPMLHDQGGALMQNEHDCNAGGPGTLGGVAVVGLFALRPRRRRAAK
jgi:uncharacterized protein (TIGR03382 family)